MKSQEVSSGSTHDRRGFTLMELLIVCTIILITIVGSTALYRNVQTSGQLNEQTSAIIQSLRTAHVHAFEGIGDTPHGVYFDINPTGDDRLVIYQGASYASRIQASDSINTFPSSVSLTLNLSTSTPEIVFDRQSGIPSATGTVVLTLIGHGSRSIVINRLGMVEEE